MLAYMRPIMMLSTLPNWARVKVCTCKLLGKSRHHRSIFACHRSTPRRRERVHTAARFAHTKYTAKTGKSRASLRLNVATFKLSPYFLYEGLKQRGILLYTCSLLHSQPHVFTHSSTNGWFRMLFLYHDRYHCKFTRLY